MILWPVFHSSKHHIFNTMSKSEKKKKQTFSLCIITFLIRFQVLSDADSTMILYLPLRDFWRCCRDSQQREQILPGVTVHLQGPWWGRYGKKAQVTLKWLYPKSRGALQRYLTTSPWFPFPLSTVSNHLHSLKFSLPYSFIHVQHPQKM